MRRDLRSRLRRAHGREASAGGGDERGLRALLQQRQSRDAERAAALLPAGETVHNEQGSCYLRQLRYPSALSHGDIELRAALEVDTARLRPLCPQPDDAACDPRQALFLDTETTGLSASAGTLVFMCGLGYFEGEEFVVEQTFLRSFAEEPAALQHVADRLAAYPQLVTFVGKSFDRHRLASRMVIHRIRSTMLTARHLDLYHLARRAYKDELPDQRLQTLERERLGVYRDDDLPGAEAPLAYQQWLQEGRGELPRVFEHNRLDVLSLVTLLARLGDF